MNWEKLEKDFKDKLHNACKFSVEHIIKDLYKMRGYDFDKEFKDESFRWQTNYDKIQKALVYGLSFGFSYMITPNEIIKAGDVENYGRDVDIEGLKEFDIIL